MGLTKRYLMATENAFEDPPYPPCQESRCNEESMEPCHECKRPFCDEHLRVEQGSGYQYCEACIDDLEREQAADADHQSYLASMARDPVPWGCASLMRGV